MDSPAAWEAYWWEARHGFSGHHGYFTVSGIVGWNHDQLDPIKNLLSSYARLGEDNAHREARVLIERALLDRTTRIAWLLDRVDARIRMDRWAHIFIDTMDAMCRPVCGKNHQPLCLEKRMAWEAEFKNKGINKLRRTSFRAMADNGRLPEMAPILTSIYDIQSQVVHGKTLNDDGFSPVATSPQSVDLIVKYTGKLILSYVSPFGSAPLVVQGDADDRIDRDSEHG